MGGAKKRMRRGRGGRRGDVYHGWFVLVGGGVFWWVRVDGMSVRLEEHSPGGWSVFSGVEKRAVSVLFGAAMEVYGLEFKEIGMSLEKKRHASSTAMDTCEAATMAANAASDTLHATDAAEESSRSFTRRMRKSRPSGVIESTVPGSPCPDGVGGRSLISPAVSSSSAVLSSPPVTLKGRSFWDALARILVYAAMAMSLAALILSVSVFFMR